MASAKLNGVEPLAWLSDVLERVVAGRRPSGWKVCWPGLGRLTGAGPNTVTVRRRLWSRQDATRDQLPSSPGFPLPSRGLR